VTGENQDLHSTILATQRASLDFDLLLQMRNKVVQSYQEVMRMQL
jgi:flagellar hook-basal body complex protein FliE